jgi:hypothetical protein
VILVNEGVGCCSAAREKTHPITANRHNTCLSMIFPVAATV